MRLSTKGRYGARAMLELALNYEKGIISLREIGQKQGISEGYLERMMTILVSAGLVRSSRGQHGGFSLARPPKEIRLSRVIQIVEGTIAPVPCLDEPKLCSRVDICVTRDIWETLKKAMLEVLDSITLEDMVKMQKKKLSRPKFQMYYI
ncbi:MAG: Rrf2 family transcriptional regulator [Candidatus Edwardsbacteria bacterium]